MVNLEHLLAKEYRTSELILPDPQDQADLITTVYSELGILSPAAAEKAPEELKPEIEKLYEEHPAMPLEPFLAINLSQAAHLNILVNSFNDIYLYSRWDSRINKRSEMWDSYDLENINRRLISRINGETPMGVRGHDLTIGNVYDEPGVFVDKQLFDAKSILEKRAGETLLNVVDWICIEALRRHAGRKSLDRGMTVTIFPQMETRIMYGRESLGSINQDCEDINMSSSFASWKHPNYSHGIRRSLGSKK